MPLQKIVMKAGVNRENTRYTNEGGWFESNNIRFRQGTPEKIGGWLQTSANTFVGICRSLWSWLTLGSLSLLGVGTNKKFYIERGGQYYDVTPTRAAVTLTNPFSVQDGSPIVTVSDASGGYLNGDYVTFYNATAVGGITVSGEYEITFLTGTTYTITAANNATSTTSGGGTVYAVYQVNTGPAYEAPLTGWGAGTWGTGAWGVGEPATFALRIWNQTNFGEDLLYGPRGGPMYYWDASVGVVGPIFTITIAAPGVVTTTVTLTEGQAISFSTTGALPSPLIPGVVYYVKNVSGTTFELSATSGGAAITTTGTQSGTHRLSAYGQPLTALPGAVEAPLTQTFFLVSDTSRFVLVFGTNDVYSTEFDPMLIRWSDQESVVDWVPAVTNQAGSIRLSHGSEIVTAIQSRQEILVWTDSSLYNLQYLGPPYVWGNQLLADNISIIGPNAVATAANVVYWMGVDKFYAYDGRTQPLKCDLLRHVYGNINLLQASQVVAGTNEGFNEIWFFYCTKNSTQNDAYVIYNYVENVWSYGSLARSAWLDIGIRSYPMAATYANNIVYHEYGVDDGTTLPAVPIEASITSAQFDIGDGHNFAFVWRLLPDVTFRGSTTGTTPQLQVYLQPLKNSGSGYTTPASVGGEDSNASATVTGIVPVVIDEYTGQVLIRIRARQMSIKITSNTLGTQWQWGSPRIDLRQDGRR